MIRLAEPADLAYLPGIDVAAGAVFRDVGMAAVADDDPPPLTWFETHLAAGRVWVWGKRKQPPVAFCLVEVVVDGTAHIAQISVHPDHARRGIGAALIAHLDQWARDRGLPEVTLTTFRDVPGTRRTTRDWDSRSSPTRTSGRDCGPCANSRSNAASTAGRESS